MSDQNLNPHRETIDRIDRELVALLSERARAAQAIGAAKVRDGGSIFVPHREQAVFDRVCGHNNGPLPDRVLRAIWREIMSGSLALEQPLTICHFGKPGAFTHQAARLKFGEGVSYTSVEAITTVFSEVERGHADYGVVPIENSTDGGITDTIDAFLATPLRIVNEMHLRIRHHLMAGCERQAIKRVYSKNTVFGQCRTWLANNLPVVDLIEVGSTTQAAERAASEEGAAAIGSRDAAAAFGIAVVAEDIEDNPTNTTRFVVLADPGKAARPSGNDKTSLMFGVQDRPGALYEALIPFHSSGISLSRIESRPSRRQAWEYLFFIDLLGHVEDQVVADAMESLSGCTSTVQVLGSYPRAEYALNES
jgi:chorismate mutase/prephenate dehydratase